MLKRRWLIPMAVAMVLGILVLNVSVIALAIAVLASATILKVGFTMLGSMSQPPEEPPPPGELRNVRIEYRCAICGAEVRMTVANDEMPEPPRHCLEDMDLVTPVHE